MSEQTEEAPTEAEAPVQEAVAREPEAIRIKIGPVRTYMACTLKLRGCKSPQMGNVFPVDKITGNLSKPFDLACSSCLTKMQDEGKWAIPK